MILLFHVGIIANKVRVVVVDCGNIDDNVVAVAVAVDVEFDVEVDKLFDLIESILFVSQSPNKSSIVHFESPNDSLTATG